MTGLVILQKIFDLTDQEVLFRLITDLSFQVALNISEATDKNLYINPKTYFNFRKKLKNNSLNGDLFSAFLKDLIEEFKIELKSQRIESPHLEKNIKKVERLSIISSTIEKFLTSLQNKAPEAFQAFAPNMEEAYLPDKETGRKLFGLNISHSKSNSAIPVVAMDLYELTIKFEAQPMVSKMAEFLLLKKVLHEQCEVRGDERQLVGLNEH
jgi:hypothetical protein